MSQESEIVARAQAFCERQGLTIDFTTNSLGFGNDGTVWGTNLNTAVKCFVHERVYRCELACYFHLQDLKVSHIDEFTIPRLIGFDDDLLAIEIEIVSRPYILDFGKCYLDAAPQHTPEVMKDWEEQYAEMWEQKWPGVKKILWRLKQLGIHYMDPKPGNIMFGDDEK